MRRNLLGIIAAAAVALAGSAIAAADHSELVKGPFQTGSDVTRACLQCHEQQAKDFMKTVHWTWSSRQRADGKEFSLGKINAVNNYCIALVRRHRHVVDYHDRLGAAGDPVLQIVRVQVQRIRPDIHKHWVSSPQHKCIHCGNKCEGRDEHFVSRLDVQEMRSHIFRMSA